MDTALGEKKSWQNSQVCTSRSLLFLPLLTWTSVAPAPPPCHPSACGLSEPPPHPSACLSVFHVFEFCACTVTPISTAVEVATHQLSVVLEGPCVPLSARKGTRCKGPAVQSHPLPLSFWQTTCTSGKVEKMRERGGGQTDTVDARK